ncbi:MAG TPA: hypothetical protein VIM90_08795 [Arenimonas sp.]
MTSSEPNVVGSVDVGVNLKDGVLGFSYLGESFKTPAGGQMSGIVLVTTGDIDLSNTPHGNVRITVSLEDTAFGAGCRFPNDPWQAVALAAASDSGPPPQPVFDKSRWPANFLAPSVSADRRSVTWVDLESDQTVYEYSVAIDGPQGRVVLDPKIKPGGSTNR